MKLFRIRIEQLKQFRQPIEIKDLEPGINLFTGPNEAGKSTIVTAIRAAFFERHRSGSVDDLRPWGDSSASPAVELEFAVGDKHYRLTKSFLGKKRCELQIGAQRLDSAEAEDHLAELLGFRYAGRGASAAEHWGIPGLLWSQQGAVQDIRESVTHATDHLHTALNESLGEIASSCGDAVLATIEAARNELLTAATGKPRGPYAEVMEKEAALADAVRQLDAEIATYRQKVDTLASLRREHAADETEKPWVSFREQEQAAADKLEAIRRIEEALAAEKLRATQIEDRIKLLHDQLETFGSQEKEVETRRVELESVRQRQAAATVLAEEWQSKRAEAEQRHEAAREALRLARQEETRRSLTREFEAMRLKAENTATALEKAETEQTALLELQRQAVASEIKLQDLELLREQHRQIRETQIQLAAAATRLHFTLEEDRSIQVGAESVAGTGERLLLEATTLTLPGLGQLEIAPGGADLSQLRRHEKELADRHEALLQRLGLSSLEAAETRHQTHTQRLADIKTAEATLQALAPQGIEPLRTELATQQVRAEEIEQALRQLPCRAERAAALPTVAEAEATEETARQSLARINDSLHEAQLAAGKEQTAFETATRELSTARALLAAPDRDERVATANRDLIDARAEQSTLAARIEALARQLAEARPEILQQDVERFRKSAEQHEKRFNERRDTLLRLEVELQAAGTQGLEERRSELARDLAQAQRRVEELRRRAHALDHLLNLLRDKRRALTRRLQAPLQKHLNRYLQLLFPEARLDIDENLTPGPLTRTGSNGTELGEFESLSFGAREQMGIISRLAYAGLLREAGRPTLIILDDALVHSDEERLAQMKRVLFDAATRHQILLFTCHPAKWRDLGVGARSLEAIRAEA
ncbi:AAA family ATPase [Methylocaldum sp.]|uniref:AAA family ATPase n=1 Tax=Methylocaldum sp. TaxID=1969727 RepID=UPI002D4E74CE|nr:AAA family ATPase [Methylocaldum sp.]HYE34485.1 AAA family ATPase [Methylocaldum sp.]